MAFSCNSHLLISRPFSLNFFVLVINYKTVPQLYYISWSVKDELSPQEVILSFGSEMMSWFLVCEMSWWSI